MARRKTINAAASPAGPVAASASEETPALEQKTNKVPSEQIIIGAHPGAEDLVKQIWERHLVYGSFRVVTIDPNHPVASLAAIAADGTVAEEFVFVPAGTFPCASVSRRELYTPLVYVGKNGARRYAHRLPQCFFKSFVTGYLIEHPEADMETLCRLQQELAGIRPVEVGFSFGNYVCPVLRGNPCEHKVLEAFVSKKFVTTTPEGWNAIAHLVKKLAEG